MIRAKSTDRVRVIEILTFAFEQNLSVNDIVKQDENRLFRIGCLMEYAYEVCNAVGKVVLSDDRNSCAMVLFPDKKRFSLRAVIGILVCCSR